MSIPPSRNLLGQAPNYQYTTPGATSSDIGSPIGLALTAIQDANNNRAAAEARAFSTGNPGLLPQDTTYTFGNLEVYNGGNFHRFYNRETKMGQVHNLETGAISDYSGDCNIF